jgi:hypothetical protein
LQTEAVLTRAFRKTFYFLERRHVNFIRRLAPGRTQQNRSSVQTKDRTKQGSASPSADRRSQINLSIYQSINLNVAKNSNNKAHSEAIDPAFETFHGLRPDTPL